MVDKMANLSPEEKQAVQEAKQQFDAMRANVTQAVSKARATTDRFLQMARERLQYAKQEQTETGELRRTLEPRKDEPGLGEHFQRMALLETMYGRLAAMLEAEIAVLESNAQQISAVPSFELRADFPEEIPISLQAPHENLAVRERRALLDVALLDYHWYRNRKSIDVVMRACGIDMRPYEADDPAQAQAAEALKAAAAGDRDTQIFLGSLGPALEEAYALLDWARDNAAGLAALPEAARREALGDADWLTLNSRLVTLLELSDRVQKMPALAPLFPYEGRVELPYKTMP